MWRRARRRRVAEFLFEIGLEEMPARMIAGAQMELQISILEMLQDGRLLEGEVTDAGIYHPKITDFRSYSTPRRIAVWFPDVTDRQHAVSEVLLGPSIKIAFKDGAPTQAAVAFAKKAEVSVDELRTINTPKGEYLVATQIKPGRSASEVIAEELPKRLARIYWAKNMYWRAGRPERFVRPVRWLLCLLGDAVVPVQFGGFTAGNTTHGHRVLAGDAPIAITGQADLAGEYERALLRGFVIADVEARRHRIRKALDTVCRTIPHTRWREDHALVDKLTHLTEWPSVIAGGFESEFLALPEEVLVTVMRDHQSYFAVEGKAGTGTGDQRSAVGGQQAGLAPYFLAVLNMEADAKGAAVIRHGNERVLRARFNDARFFWEFDQRVPLVERVALLEKVTFQKELGSYAAKTERVRVVAAALAGQAASRGLAVDTVAVDEAARLAKTDLTTELVKEFTELQGQVGGLYARAQGLPAAVADAIYDQYRPVSMEDAVPRTVEGALLALADKADTIAGMFGLGMEPTGSKDPFALRRAANGIVKILAEGAPALPLTLGDVADAATKVEAVRLRVEVFFAERLEFYLREAKGQAYDVVKAVLAAGANDVRDAVARAEAVTAVRGSEDFAAVSAAFKRMKNIVMQANLEMPEQTEGIGAIAGGLSKGQLHPAQRELLIAAAETGKTVDSLRRSRDYVKALEAIATLRAPVDAFFDQVMVMDPDEGVRNSRVILLMTILRSFSGIADFSEIVTAG
jgi:glycyl-tRNA synthetase beta chain